MAPRICLLRCSGIHQPRLPHWQGSQTKSRPASFGRIEQCYQPRNFGRYKRLQYDPGHPSKRQMGEPREVARETSRVPL